MNDYPRNQIEDDVNAFALERRRALCGQELYVVTFVTISHYNAN